MYRQESIKPYTDTEGKTAQVERMFDHIAPTYDTLNHVLSLGIDRLWRRQALRSLERKGHRPSRILDVATGTGDFSILAARRWPESRITATDLSEKMMERGREKARKAGVGNRIHFEQEDCAHMRYAGHSFDTLLSAFALRNFENLDQCLSEMWRVLEPGGCFAVIDLCQPVAFPMKHLFKAYQRVVMPSVGRLISRDKRAYSYLPATMRAVPQGDDMAAIFRKAGFSDVSYRRLPFGMCILYEGRKEP